MTREIRFNAFDMNCVGHQSPGLWAHPRDRSWHYKDLEYWIELAEILERGKFDGLFIADVLGVYDVYHGNLDAAIRNSTQIPVNDPLAARAGDGAGHRASRLRADRFAVLRASLPVRAPHVDARSSDQGPRWLEHRHLLSRQRREEYRLGGQSAHDDRYDVADEYMEVCYKLWEGSWEDDAVLPRPRAPHLHRSREGASDPPRGPLFQGPRHPPLRALAATHAGALSGGRFVARAQLRRRACRMRLHRDAVEGRSQEVRRRDPRKRRSRRPRSAERPHLQSADGDRRRD